MGRKKQQKASSLIRIASPQKLSPQKRNDLNQQVEKLLKVTSKISASQNLSNWDSHLDIDKILKRVMALESDLFKKPSTRNSSSCQKLSEWMKVNGSHINGVEISDFGSLGYGLKVSKNILENELVVSVPRKLMLTSEYAEKSDLGELARNDPMLQNMPNVTLALLVLLERFKEDSFWSPYINMLPEVYNTIIYFTPEQIMELKGSPAYESALKQCKNIARQFAYFYNIFQKSESVPSILKDVFTYEHYRWAVSTVMTRQNSIPSTAPGKGMVNALIPFWDMANHTHAKVTTDYNLDKEASECFACKDFISGDQFTMSYGERTNHDLLIHNGFVYPENPCDSLGVQLGISRSDPLFENRARLLEALKIPNSGLYSIRKGSSPINPHLHAFLRVFCMTEGELEKWIASENAFDLISDECVLDISLETKVLEFLVMRGKLILSTYKTSLKEDEELLSNEIDMNACLKLAILQRVTEKRILNNMIEYTNSKLQQYKEK